MPTGYSASSQSRKLGLKPGIRLALDGAPPGWRLDDPPPGLVWVAAREPADLVIAFVRAAAELEPRLPALVERIYPAGGLWVAWPRRAGGHESDLSDTLIRSRALDVGVVDVKVAAIDDDWSGLRFVWRVENRTRG